MLSTFFDVPPPIGKLQIFLYDILINFTTACKLLVLQMTIIFSQYFHFSCKMFYDERSCLCPITH
jgi:hypothetical protein